MRELTYDEGKRDGLAEHEPLLRLLDELCAVVLDEASPATTRLRRIRLAKDRVQQLRAEVERLRDLVASAAPLRWTHTADHDGARQWEIAAEAALAKEHGNG